MRGAATTKVASCFSARSHPVCPEPSRRRAGRVRLPPRIAPCPVREWASGGCAVCRFHGLKAVLRVKRTIPAVRQKVIRLFVSIRSLLPLQIGWDTSVFGADTGSAPTDCPMRTGATVGATPCGCPPLAGQTRRSAPTQYAVRIRRVYLFPCSARSRASSSCTSFWNCAGSLVARLRSRSLCFRPAPVAQVAAGSST
jgi:hypothetical protein